MATSSHKARLLVHNNSVTAMVSSVTAGATTEMLDVTTLNDSSKRFIAGLGDGTLTCEGFADAAVISAFPNAYAIGEFFVTTPYAVTYAPLGTSLGSPAIILPTRQASFEMGTEVNGAANFSFQAQADGQIGVGGIVLHDLTAETADVDHTSVDRGVTSTSGGAVAAIHVTAYSGLTNTIVTLQDSANNTDFTGLVSFNTATATGSQFLYHSGTIRRYVRCVTNVTGTGSITYACSIAPL